MSSTTIKVKYGDKVRVESRRDSGGIWLDLLNSDNEGWAAGLSVKQVKRLRAALKEAIK
jgi:hypothetical protein